MNEPVKQDAAVVVQKCRVDIFANAAILCAVLGWGLGLLLGFDLRMFWNKEETVLNVVILLTLLALLTGVISFIRRWFNKKLSGSGRANTGLILGLIFWIVIMPAVIRSRQGAEIVQTLQKTNELGKIMTAYSNSHNGRYPAPDKWCDLLVEFDPKAREFLTPTGKARKGDVNRCVYAMNPYCEPNTSEYTVLLFEIKGGWNQYGGSELMFFDNHAVKGATVLFQNGFSAFIYLKNIGELKWKVEDVNSSN